MLLPLQPLVSRFMTGIWRPGAPIPGYGAVSKKVPVLSIGPGLIAFVPGRLEGRVSPCGYSYAFWLMCPFSKAGQPVQNALLRSNLLDVPYVPSHVPFRQTLGFQSRQQPFSQSHP